MKPARLLAVLTLALAFAGCAETADTASPETKSEAASKAAPAEPPAKREACQEPSGQEKAAVRLAAEGQVLEDSPWARATSGKAVFLAAVVNGDAPRVLLVRYREDAAFLSGLRAVNGTARTLTDLPSAGAKVPVAGERALGCVS